MDKYIGDIAYYTCGVKRGKCFGVVTVSAKGSFVGRTASLVSSKFSCNSSGIADGQFQVPMRKVIFRLFSVALEPRKFVGSRKLGSIELINL